MSGDRDDLVAPPGTVWVCGACGKTHRHRYGNGIEGDDGWDESCALRAVLCDESSIEIGPTGRVERARALVPENSDAR